MNAADEGEEEWLHLPSFDEIMQRFSLFSTSTTCNPQVGPGGSLDCKCQGCTEWHAFVEGHSPFCKEVQYEVFTEEHVKGLADYLLLQAAEYKLPLMEVLEVGAGSGRLNHHLKRFLDQMSLDSKGWVVHVTASDSGERGLNGPNVNFQDALEAVTEGSPQVVIVSWMPMGVDWTAHIRATPSVLEYILIGETDDGICGDPWLTWGIKSSGDVSSESSPENLDLDFSSTYEHAAGITCSTYGPGKAAVIVESESNYVETDSSDPCMRSDSHLAINRDRISSEPLPPYEADGWDAKHSMEDNCSDLTDCRLPHVLTWTAKTNRVEACWDDCYKSLQHVLSRTRDEALDEGHERSAPFISLVRTNWLLKAALRSLSLSADVTQAVVR